jgi:hypothetical protein
MMNKLMTYDPATKTTEPLKVLILGDWNAGKTTFLGMLKEMEPRLVPYDTSSALPSVEDAVNVNVLVCNSDAVLTDIISMAMGSTALKATHIFWVDAGERMEREEGYQYPIEFDPDMMIMVDNSQDLDYLREEATMCLDLMNLVPENDDV